MRRIETGESGSPSGGGLYPRPRQAEATVADARAAARPPRGFPDIVIRRMTHLGGPGIWTYRPVIEAVVDIGALEEHPSNTLPGFYDRLTAWLPGLIEHRCSVGRRGGFLMRLRDGTWPGHILEHVALELQTQAGMKTGFGKARMTGEHGVYKVVIRTRNEAVGKLAIESARDLVMAAINDRPYDVAATIARLTDLVDRQCLGPSTACIVDAATERGIPHIRLNDGNLVQLGYGARQRRIWTAESEFTSAIAEGIASDKDLTKSLLKSCGVPIPDGQVVNSPEEAWEAAEDIGLPVVVKPSDGNHGRGVTLDLRERADIEAAWHVAEPEGSEVMVERFIPGDEHRLLVVGGKLVAAARGELVGITGNGQSSVRELIDAQLNSDPRRGHEEEYPLEVIDLATDAKAQLELKRQGLDADAVPAAGRHVVVQRNGNVAVDCTDDVHPEVAYIAQLAARVVGLDIAGIDMVAQDISKPLHAQGGAIVEVNAGPGLLMHLKPAVGAPRPVGQAIAEHLFPLEDGKTAAQIGRIPVVGVAGTQDTTTIARLVAWLVHLSGRYTGLACTAGMFMNQRRVDARNSAHWAGAHSLLMSQMVQAAVIENDARAILQDGLAYDRCSVGVVTDMGGWEGLAHFDIHAADQMPRVLRTQVDVVLAEGAAVLNADAPQVAELAPLCDGAVILYSTDADHPAVAAHRAEGQGRAVLVRAGNVVLATGASEKSLGALARLHFGRDLAPPPVATLLAAIGAAWALDIAPDLIAAGIKTFEPEQPSAAPSTSPRIPVLPL